MKHLRIFGSVSDMNTAIASSEIGILGLAYDNGTPVVKTKVVAPVPPTPSYSTPFYIDVRGTLKLDDPENLLMSTDGETWTEISVTELSTGRTYFRVASDLEEPQLLYYIEDEDSDYDIGGNINSLVKINFENDTNCYYFEEFFLEKNKLKSAGNLILPATTLTIMGCYSGMFNGCTSLIAAPVLPATTLNGSCYSTMFSGCTSLTTAPELPATTVADDCYDMMFQGCTSLTTVPALPATTLANNCYSDMFTGCTSLTEAPVLPATTLATSCYRDMFTDCTSLTIAPELPATTLATSCYRDMFNGCTSLTVSSVSNLGLESATTLAESCYSGMFYGIDNGQEMSESDYRGWCNSHLPQGYSKNTHGQLFNYIPDPV